MQRTPLTKTLSSNTGAWVEQQAKQWLCNQGLQFISSNYRCRQGEIDIIMCDKQQLVFVEVRFRKHRLYGDGLESVDWRKQKKLLKAAAHYLLMHPKRRRQACRFDVVAARLDDNNKLQWQWVQDAFCG